MKHWQIRETGAYGAFELGRFLVQGRLIPTYIQPAEWLGVLEALSNGNHAEAAFCLGNYGGPTLQAVQTALLAVVKDEFYRERPVHVTALALCAKLNHYINRGEVPGDSYLEPEAEAAEEL